MSSTTHTSWFLEGALGPSKTLVVPLETFPFIIGRHPDCHLSIASKEMSRTHAAITTAGNMLFITDSESTNGTYVNRQRIAKTTPIKEGDVLHFGTIEFRVQQNQAVNIQAELEEDSDSTMIRQISHPDQELPQQFVTCENEFSELLQQRLVNTLLQPILRFDTEKVVAYEVLGRGAHSGLPQGPYQLFTIAEKLGLAEHLSRVLRQVGIESALKLPEAATIFLNTHPAEMFKPELVSSLKQLREIAVNLPIVLEIHETAVTRVEEMLKLMEVLKSLNILLAYDDFGAGQARLNELVDVPPDYLKFDITLIRNIHVASAKKQNLVKTLVDMTNDLGIATLAEGVEYEEEAKVCKQMGFTHVQGYFYGRPADVSAYRK